jgi:ankyrin repeat protein
MARLLIARGALVNAHADNGTTALMMASREGHLSMVLLLLEHGADINVRNLDGQSALALARDRERKDIVSVLSRAGATD